LTQVRRFLVVLTLSVKLPSYFLSLSDYFILDLVWVSFGYMEGGVFHFITVFVVNGYLGGNRNYPKWTWKYRYNFNLALNQNLQRSQLEYAMIIHSSPQLVYISKCEGFRGSCYICRVIILRISSYPQYHHSPNIWIFVFPWHFGTHSPQRLLWNGKHPLPYIQN
jgi:hypothetical protein